MPKFRFWPSPLDRLIRFDGDVISNRFMRLIRQYNSMFCYTSLGAHIDNSINVGGAPFAFKMNGVVYHRIGPLVPPDGLSPKFAQLYMIDSGDKVDSRLNVFARDDGSSLCPDPKIVASIIRMLDMYNPLVHKFRLARQSLCSPDAPRVSIRL